MKKIILSIKMMITAVICFTMCLFSGKNIKGKVNDMLLHGQAVPDCTEKNYINIDNKRKNNKENINNKYQEKGYSQDLFMKKIFYWLKGPGDRKGEKLPHSHLSGFV